MFYLGYDFTGQMTEAVSTGVKVDVTPPLKTQLPIRIDKQYISDVKSVSVWYVRFYKISSKRRTFGSKEHTKETKTADSVLLSLFMCSNAMLHAHLAPASAELYFQTDL